MKKLLILLTILITAPTAFAISSEQMQSYAQYGDGTQSANSVTCDGLGCCEKFLSGLEDGTWRFIRKLECVNENGEFKTYVDGKEDIKTSIKTTYGNNSPIVETNGEGNKVTVNNDGIVANLSLPQKSLIVVIVGAVIAVLSRLAYKKIKK